MLYFFIPIKSITFAHANKKWGSVAQLNRASDYGSEGSGFESQQSHKKRSSLLNFSFFLYPGLDFPSLTEYLFNITRLTLVDKGFVTLWY